ncbi:MAG: hypothetical protein QMD71_09060 [bacterium]|nr:hypothetical protein [bacterium]
MGEFHGNEVSAKSGEAWFGLYLTENGYELIPSKITVEAIYDPIVNNKNEETGKRVSVDQTTKLLFLMKGLESLKSGVVKTLFSGREFLYPAQSMTLKFTEKNYYDLTAFGEAMDRGIASLCLKNLVLQTKICNLEIKKRIADTSYPRYSIYFNFYILW